MVLGWQCDPLFSPWPFYSLDIACTSPRELSQKRQSHRGLIAREVLQVKELMRQTIGEKNMDNCHWTIGILLDKPCPSWESIKLKAQTGPDTQQISMALTPIC